MWPSHDSKARCITAPSPPPCPVVIQNELRLLAINAIYSAHANLAQRVLDLCRGAELTLLELMMLQIPLCSAQLPSVGHSAQSAGKYAVVGEPQRVARHPGCQGAYLWARSV